jgi:glyoxylase-like metal-dependent hydrolase (beta-lactamase superfamily II)
VRIAHKTSEILNYACGAPVKLYVIDGGIIDILDWSLFDPATSPGTHRRLAAPAFLVEHRAGTLLWDAGLGDSLLAHPQGREIEGIARFTVTAGLADQLVGIGYAPCQIRYLALSHFHPDHVGNANLFASAELLVQEDEYAAAFGADAASFGYDPGGYASLRETRVTRLQGDHDVFGDGTVLIKRYPGHTPGSQSLLLHLPETGPVLISGDLAHSRHNWDHDVVPGLNFSKEATLASLHAARGDLADSGAQLWIQHEYDHWAAARHAPACYA